MVRNGKLYALKEKSTSVRLCANLHMYTTPLAGNSSRGIAIQCGTIAVIPIYGCMHALQLLNQFTDLLIYCHCCEHNRSLLTLRNYAGIMGRG